MRRKILALLLVAAVLLALPVSAMAATISFPVKVGLMIEGETVTLKPKLSRVKLGNLTWTSSDESVLALAGNVARALKPGGFLECKTDNDDLFTFTLEEIAVCGWTPEQMEWDLHSTDLPAARVMTEYEKKFRRAGKKIHYVRVVF